jgi:Na+/H+-dicarboxylate symporter
MNKEVRTISDEKLRSGNKYQFLIWVSALISGALLGCLKVDTLNTLFNFIATVFTRLFQFVAVPTIALSVITTLSELGTKKSTGQIFFRTLIYTLLTTFLAAIVALGFYILFEPENISHVSIQSSNTNLKDFSTLSYCEYILSIIPDNILQPLISGNILSVMITAAGIGIGLSFAPETENKTTLLRFFHGFQELLFTFIRALIYILPLGIMAFSAQLSAQIASGSVIGALGKYIAIILCSNLVQALIIIPMLLLIRGLNPIYVFRKMLPAVIIAFFSKSSVGTLPVTLASAENSLNINPKISRFVLPICTTINMNGCAAFILITSLFVMQNAGIPLTASLTVSWIFISVFAAIGNAGVPMGCYFLTMSLMSSIGVPLGLLSVILPIYTIIDMVETAENVWSDSAVCAMTNKDLSRKFNLD